MRRSPKYHHLSGACGGLTLLFDGAMVAFHGVVSAQEDWLSLAGAVIAAVMKCWPSDIMPPRDSQSQALKQPRYCFRAYCFN